MGINRANLSNKYYIYINLLSKTFFHQYHSSHPLPISISEFFNFIKLLAKTALELSQCLYLISCSDSNRFNTLQGKPNHTTCGHSRSPTWQPFTSRRPGFPTCNTYSERSIPLVSRAPA